MERCRDLYGGNRGERLDTIEGPYDLYDQEDDQDAKSDGFAQMKDDSDDSGDELNLAGDKKVKKKLNQSHDKLEVNLDDINDEDDQEDLLYYGN